MMALQDTSQRYQYRTFAFAYDVKIKGDQSFGLKIYTPDEQVVFKKVFSWAEIGMVKENLSEGTVCKIIDLLGQRKLLPLQYLLSAPEERAPFLSPPPTAIQAAVPAVLDPQMLTMLQELSLKSETFFSTAELREQQAIQDVINNPQAIRRLIVSQNKEEQALGELLLLKQQPPLYKYYQTVYQKMTGICIASYTIKCGMVENAQKDTYGYISEVLKCTGQAASVAGLGFTIISGLLKLKNIKNNHHAVAHLIAFFADFDQSLRDIKTIARTLAREQERDILTVKPLGRFKGAFSALKDWFTADESDNPVVVMGVEDCQILLGAILAEELQTDATPEHVVSHILGRPLTKPALASTLYIGATSGPAFSASPVDVASKDEVRSVREEHERKFSVMEEEQKELRRRLHEAERAAQKARHEARLAKDALELIHGPILDLGTQIQDQDNPHAASQGNTVLRSIYRRLDVVETHVGDVAVVAAVLQEQTTGVERRLDHVEAVQDKN